ncbi:MAG: hypothetical protein ABI743_08155 [bacterium]
MPYAKKPKPPRRDPNALPLAIINHRTLFLHIPHTVDAGTIYEATRFEWALDAERAAEAEIILAHANGLILEAFSASAWLESNEANFPGRDPTPGRFGFIGELASQEIRDHYVGKAVPSKYRRGRNPVRYSYEKGEGDPLRAQAYQSFHGSGQ